MKRCLRESKTLSYIRGRGDAIVVIRLQEVPTPHSLSRRRNSLFNIHNYRQPRMPAQSTLSADDKARIKSAVPTSSNKIHTAARARIYYAYPQPDRWSYAGLQGALVLSRDNTKGVLSFKLVDLDGTRGLIWEHELYEGMEYHPDRHFFHSFAGDVSSIFFMNSNML